MDISYDKDSGRKLIMTRRYLIKVPASLSELLTACKANLREHFHWSEVREFSTAKNHLPVKYCDLIGLVLVMPRPSDVPFEDGKLAKAIINKANSRIPEIPYTVFDLGKYNDRVVFKHYYKG